MIRPEARGGPNPDTHKWLVVTGTVNEGFTFYGPFDSAKDADHWASLYFKRDAYELADLLQPAEVK